MAEDRLIELLRALPPAPPEWVAEAQDVAAHAPAEDDPVDPGDDGGRSDDVEDSVDDGLSELDDDEGLGNPGGDQGDGPDPW